MWPVYRSMLFVSGETPERFPKALAAGADLVCIDLEDAVAGDRKQQARQDALAFASAHRAEPLALRINGLRTREGLADVLALIESQVCLDAVILPKVESVDEVALFQAWATGRFKQIVALIESPLGLERAAQIARAALHEAPGLGALMLGGADLSAELQASFDWDGLRHARGCLVTAARASGLQAWDVPYIDLADPEALADESRRVLRLGFDCKTAIHPSQIPVIHRAFAPSDAETRWANALLAQVEQRGQSAGAFLFEGRMVDPPVLAKARQIAKRASFNPVN